MSNDECRMEQRSRKMLANEAEMFRFGEPEWAGA